MFYDYWLTKTESDQFDRLGKMLGVIWDRADVEKDAEQEERGRRTAPDRISIPLTLAMEPGIQEQVKKMMGKKLGIRPPKWAKGDELVDLFETPRDAFMGFVDSFVRPKVVGK